MSKQDKKWEEKFDKKFVDYTGGVPEEYQWWKLRGAYPSPLDVKSFIAKLLSEARKAGYKKGWEDGFIESSEGYRISEETKSKIRVAARKEAVSDFARSFWAIQPFMINPKKWKGEWGSGYKLALKLFEETAKRYGLKDDELPRRKGKLNIPRILEAARKAGKTFEDDERTKGVKINGH